MPGVEVKFMFAVIIGAVFGIALEKGRVFEPLIIRQQMSWQNLLMLKMFLSACMASLISMSIVYIVSRKKFDSVRKCRGKIAQVVVGCAILGAGMTVSGSCPGTILAQVGSGVSSSYIAILGGLVGALVFTQFKDQIVSPFKSNLGIKEGYLEERMGVPFHFIAIPLAGLFFVVVAALEYIKPWYTEYEVDQNDYFPSMAATAWPPYFSGLIIGFLQIFSVFLLQKPLGCSSPYERVAAYIHKATGLCKSSYIEKLSEPTFDNTWSLFLLAGATLGAAFSSIYSGSFHQAASLSFSASFFGGFMIIMGARIAGGCTSGHGISGFSSLGIESLFSVPAMFGSGTIVALCFF